MTTLGRLQRAVVSGRPTDPHPTDGSVSVHACIGPTRQVEVLRELVQGWLDTGVRADGRRLEPRDVLIMTPDIETYAPLVDAAFRAQRRGVDSAGRALTLPAIPVHIADLGLRQTNGVADTLGRLIAMARARVTLPSLAGLLSLPVVRARFGLDAREAERATALLADAGARWGLDGADRAAALGRPDEVQAADRQHTLDAAIDRLVHGAVVPGDDPPDVILGLDDGELLAPWAALGDDDVRLVAALAGFATAVRETCVALRAGPRAWAAWHALLRAAIEATTNAEGPSAWLEADVRAVLDHLAPDDAVLTIDAVDALLAGRFDIPRRGDRPVTGAVTMCALEPMRSVPFEAVVLLGLDEELYPRSSTARGHDPLVGRERVGDPDRATIDRHLLLEALLSARSRLAILYGGRDPHRGEALPIALPVHALLDVLQLEPSEVRGEGRPAGSGAAITWHPLQPWSPAAFASARGDARSFDAALAAEPTTPRLRSAGRWHAQPGFGGPDGVDGAGPTAARHWTTDELAAVLAEPARHLRRERLGVRPRSSTDGLDEREALTVDALSGWALIDETLRHAERGGALDIERTLARQLADGRVPATSVGRAAARSRLEVGHTLAQIAAQLPRATAPTHAPLALAIEDTWTLAGQVARRPDWLPGGPIWPGARRVVLDADSELRRGALAGGRSLLMVPSSRSIGRDLPLLRAWVALCAAAALEGPDAPLGAVVVGTTYDKRRPGVTLPALVGLTNPGGVAARAWLVEAARIGLYADLLAVPLFGRVSLGLAVATHDNSQAIEGALSVGKPHTRWIGHGFRGVPGVRDDEDIAAVFNVTALQAHGVGHKDPERWPPELRTLAALVWGPLLDALIDVAPDAVGDAAWPADPTTGDAAEATR